MSVWRVIAVVGLLAFGAPASLLAGEPPCIAVDIFGIASTMKSEVRDQLASELGIPIETAWDSDACLTLRMVFEAQQAVIEIAKEPHLHTTLRLDRVPPRHWPRAAALSAAGLLVRRKTLTDAAAKETADTPSASAAEPQKGPTAGSSDNDETAPDRDSSSPEDEGTTAKEKTRSSRDTASHSKTTARGDIRSETLGLALGLRLGGRLMPRFPAGVGEAAAGVHLSMGTVVLGVSVVGVYGRRTVRLGSIHTTGGGLELSVRWHAVELKRFHLTLGPAMEALAIYGYGRETTLAEANNALSLAVTARLLVEIGFDLTERLRLCLALSGGYNPIGVTLQANHKDVSGLTGGYMTLATGFDFSLL